MKINIEMEAWELATVIKGLTINAQPEEKKPILSDKTREELKNAIANAIANASKVPEKVTTLPQKTESKESCSVSKDTLDAFGVLLRQRLKINEILDESKHREDNPNPNYRPPMGGKNQ